MKRTKWLILCLVLCMAASLGGTIAYLTDSDGDVNVMTLGNVHIELIEQERQGNTLGDFSDDKMMLPLVGTLDQAGLYGLPSTTNFLDKIVRVQCTSSNANAYLRVYIGLPSALRNVAGTGLDALHMLTGENVTLPGSNPAGSWKLLRVEQTSIDGVPFEMHCFEYQKLLTPGELTPPVLAGLWLDSHLNSDNGDPDHYIMEANGAKYPLDYDFSVGLQVPVLVQAVQADGFSSAAQAFAASDMDHPNFSDLLDIKMPIDLPSVLEELLESIEAMFKAGDDSHPVTVTADTLDFSNTAFTKQLTELAALSPNTQLTIQPEAPNEGEPITIDMGKTVLPANVIIMAPTGQKLIITGEDPN